MFLQLSRRLSQSYSHFKDRNFTFKPQIKTFYLDSISWRFFFATPQAVEWYGTIHPTLRKELSWISRRIYGHNERMLDAGAYHGVYSLVMGKSAAKDSKLISVDAVPSNAAITEANLALNDLKGKVVVAAVAIQDGPVNFTEGSCGRIADSGTVECSGLRLQTLMPNATVVKLDIEGVEGDILIKEIEVMNSVHTWIIELHPDLGCDVHKTIELLRDTGFQLEYLERNTGAIIPLTAEDLGYQRFSLFATRPRLLANTTARK